MAIDITFLIPPAGKVRVVSDEEFDSVEDSRKIRESDWLRIVNLVQAFPPEDGKPGAALKSIVFERERQVSGD